MTCPTTSGPYRCAKAEGHAGECECYARAYDPRARVVALERRVRVLEEQVASLQMAAPRGIPGLAKEGKR